MAITMGDRYWLTRFALLRGLGFEPDRDAIRDVTLEG